MDVQVKICGITSLEAADAAMRGRADFGGLLFRPGSPRHLTPEMAVRLSERMRGRLRIVAVLSNAGDEDVVSAIAAARPDFVQLHGAEPPRRVAELRARFNVPVIKALAIADAADFADVAAYETVADMLLFDARPPSSADREGGHGAPFDWQLLRGRTFRRPWLLAGGLTPENVARAVQVAGAGAVDVSSGVETSPGVKDAELIRSFINAARAPHNANFPA